MDSADFKLLAEFDPEAAKSKAANFTYRQAARAVVFDIDGKIALLDVTNQGYHKLPGGGIEGDEQILDALIRECEEEIGCKVSARAPVGRIIEYRPQNTIVQESYCFTATVIGEKGENQLTPEEIADGFRVLWVSIEKAIDLLESDGPRNYTGGYIVQRDLLFLKSALLT